MHKQFKNDIFLLDKITSYLFYFADVSNAMLEIKTKLYEELDYTIEFENQSKIYNLWKDHKYIKISKLIPELCTKTLLTMHYIEAEGIFSFFETATQAEKNLIGRYLVEFIFTNFYKHGIFYSDIHYGNFLVKDKTQLFITDFGCLNMIEPILLQNLLDLHTAIFNEDEKLFYVIVHKIGILKNDISDKSREYMYEYFKLQYEPWTCGHFKFTEEWLAKSVYKKTELMNEWRLPSNCVYLNKIPYGMYHLLTKLHMEGDFVDFFKDLLKTTYS